MTITKSGRLHANTKCQRCGCRNTDPLNLVKVHPDTKAVRCMECHYDVTVYGKPEEW